MGCFHVQKIRKLKVEEQTVKLDVPAEPDESEAPSPSPSASHPALSTPPSFRKTAKAIQNAQRFIIHSNPKLRSSHPSYGSRENQSDQGVTLSDTAAPSKPMPLPSPRLTGYILPHPFEIPHAATSPNLNPRSKNASSAGHAALNNRVFPWDLQPLPPPKEAMAIPRGLKSFSYEELSAACLQFSHQTSVGDDGISFAGAIKAGVKGSMQQAVIIVRLHESSHRGLKEWMSELSTIRHVHNSHLCKLVGFYAEDNTREHLLVYQKLQKGSLHSLLFEASDSPPLDWSTRMKIVLGAAQGLASLHEKSPEQILYRDFRLSHIQIDSDYNSKLSGYGFISWNNQVFNSSCKARESAYSAPEARNGGIMTLKSNVWSFGVVLLELLCGRKNKDERIAKDEKHDLVKWAKPFLLEDSRLFLIMDPKLQGRFPAKGAKIIANLILQCLQKDPTRRPTMKVALEIVKVTQETRHPSLALATWKELSKQELAMHASAPLPSLGVLQSVKPGIVDRMPSSYNRSPTKFDLIQSPHLKPLIITASYNRSPTKFDRIQSPHLKPLIIPLRSSD